MSRVACLLNWMTPILTIALGGLFSVNLIADQVVLEPAKDTTIYQDAEGVLSNGSGDFVFAGINGPTGGNRILRVLLAFDLSLIPAGSTIDSVSLVS